jgi:hypothetical protein
VIQQRISAYMAAADADTPSKAADDRAPGLRQFAPDAATSSDWGTHTHTAEGLAYEELRSKYEENALLLNLATEELKSKNEENALLLHLANSNNNSPITAELSRQLIAALGQCVCEGGAVGKMQQWLHEMDRQREVWEVERAEQAETACLLNEARQAMAQLIVHKCEEVQDSSRDLELVSDALEDGVLLLEGILPALTNSVLNQVHRLEGNVIKVTQDREHLRASLLQAKDALQNQLRLKNESSDDDEVAATAA